jgi:phthiodiolone/phenolphthiodiolone dimycocerosates ketoreductase
MDPFVAAAIAAHVGSFERLGIAVTDPFRRHPATLLQSAASVASAGPAFALGLGVGAPAYLRPIGISLPGRFQRLAAAADHIARLRDEDGPVWQTEGPYPLRGALSSIAARRRVGIWFGGSNPEVLAASGRYGEGWIPVGLSDDEYARQLGLVRDTAAILGRPQPIASLWVFTMVASDHAEAHEMLEAAALRTLLFFRGEAFFRGNGLHHPLAGIAEELAYIPSLLTAEQVVVAAQATPAELVHDYIVHGTPDEVGAWVESMARHGLQHVVLWDLAHLSEPEPGRRAIFDLFRLEDGLR